MIRHPNVIAAAILGGCVLISAVLICVYLGGVSAAIRDKPVATPAVMPKEMEVGGSLTVHLENGRVGEDVHPLRLKQVP